MLFALLATLALLAVIGLTVLLAADTDFFRKSPPSGPDTMGYAAVFFAMLFELAAVMVAVACVSANGGFDWVSDRGLYQTLAPLAAAVGVGLVSGTMWFTWAGPRRWYVPLVANAGGLVLPVAACVYLLALAWTPGDELAGSNWPRRWGYLFGGIGAIGLTGAAVAFVSWKVQRVRWMEREMREEEARWQRMRDENAARERQQAEELAALPDTAPLEQFLTHLFIDKSDAHHKVALERIDRLPDLATQLQRVLTNPNPRHRGYGTNYINMCRQPDPVWGPSVRRAIGLLAADVRSAPALYEPVTQLTYRGLTLGCLKAARRFPGEDFTTELAMLRAAVGEKANDPSREATLELIGRFERGEPLTNAD